MRSETDHISRVENGIAGFALAHHPAKGDIALDIIMNQGRTFFGRFFRVDDHRQLFILDDHRVSRVLRAIAVVSQHDRHAIADIADLAFRQSGMLGRLQVAIGDEPGGGYARQTVADILAGVDGDYALHGFGGAAVDADDVGMRVGTAHHRHVQDARQLDVVGIARFSGDQPRIFPPLDAGAKYSRCHLSPPSAPAAASATCLTALTML